MIRTDRLLLRRARPEDAEAMNRILGNPEAMRYWDSLPHTDFDQTRGWVEHMSSLPPDSDDFILERDGEVIGKAGCYRAPEIGFILHPDHWRQGLATEALTAIIPHIFAMLRPPALTADVDPRNTACLRLLTKLGFEETHRASNTILVGDEWCDSIYLALPSPWSVTRDSLSQSSW